jgi:ribosomal protein S12 methylthiotransferase accessory factor
VTDITRLDRIGVPVFTSVRPAAVAGSLCVNAGKGVRAIDAQIGAFMEAIEFAMAEPGRAPLEVTMATARDVLDGATRPEAIFELCPIAGRQITLATPIACVEATDIISGAATLVPAELAFLPYVHRPGTGYFGSSSNGLASGNTRDEAALHALCEVVERDIRSFETIRGTLRPIRLETLPPVARDMAARIHDVGLQLCVRTAPNAFDMPFFDAAVWDPTANSRFYLSGGYGCHLVREIALNRAITEALQSRLSCIHGARDDLGERYDVLAKLSETERAGDAVRQFAALTDGVPTVDYDDAPDWAPHVASVEDALSHVIERLQRHGVRQVCRVAFTEASAPLHVVRLIVPGLEFFNWACHRIGPRLYGFLQRGAA